MTTFTFPALPYAYDALEPSIDKLTVEIHYSRHHKAYFDNFVANVGETDLDLVGVLNNISKFSSAVRNNGGGLFNHTLYWNTMSADGKRAPEGKLLNAINETFGSFEAFKAAFKDAGIKQFGSGWAWLIVNAEGKLQITSTPNQDNPLMDVVAVRGKPILGCDVWEHAYYLNYQNKRADYLDAWWNVVDWAAVEANYQKATSSGCGCSCSH